MNGRLLHEIIHRLLVVVDYVFVEAHVETLELQSILLLFLFTRIFHLFLLHRLEVLVPIKIVALVLRCPNFLLTLSFPLLELLIVKVLVGSGAVVILILPFGPVALVAVVIIVVVIVVILVLLLPIIVILLKLEV